MSMTKRAMEADIESAETNKRANCGCRYNWDDKFWEECPEHAEESAQQLEEERHHYE